MSYKPHQALVKPALASASLRRLVVGVVTLISVFLLMGYGASSLQDMLMAPDARYRWSHALNTGSTPLAALVNLYFFVFVVVALGVTMRVVHNRSWIGVIGTPSLAILQFWQVTKGLLALNAILMFVPSPDGFELSLNMAVGLWLIYLPLTLLGLLIQTGSEELVFRGYLQSQLAARTNSPLIWIGLPSILFGLLHYDPSLDDSVAWLIVLWAVLFAICTADLTARSGTLGPAISLHFINNILAISFAAPEGNFDGVALYNYPFEDAYTDLMLAAMPIEVMILLCSWLVARIAIRA